MDPATYRLLILRPVPEDRWRALQAELDAQGAPLIAMAREDGSVAFEAPTGAFMLRARVSQAVADLWGHGEWERTFGPVD